MNKIKCNHIQLSLLACDCPSLSLSVYVCACDTVDNAVVVAVEVVVSHSHPTPHQHCTLHSACPFCSRVVGRALFSHEIPLLFQLLLLLLFSHFFFLLSFSCFVHGEFFLYFICARVCPVRLQLPYPVPVFFRGLWERVKNLGTQ